MEIQATPRPGTAVAHDEGLVVVIDTELTPELRAEGDARELQRAIQDARKDAGVELDDEVARPSRGAAEVRAGRSRRILGSVEAETRSKIEFGPVPARATALGRRSRLGSGCGSACCPKAVAP